MPAYAYQVRDRNGKKLKGVMEAVSQRTAADNLLQQGYLIAAIKPNRPFTLSGDFFSLSKRVSSDDLTMFYFQLGNLVEAGVPLLSALQSVTKQGECESFRKIVQDLSSRVEGGMSFSEALGCHERTFPILYRSMIRVGETSGNLAETLRYVSELNEASDELRYQVRSALAYPIVLMTASIAVVIFMVVWIIPTFTMIFEKAGIPLPLPTRIVYGVSLWLKSNPWLAVIFSAVLVIGSRLLVRLQVVKYFCDRFWLSVPSLGFLIQRIEVARWSRSVALMLSSGVPILQALEIAQGLTNNLLFRDVLANASTNVQAGGKLADSLMKSALFPADAIQMVETGENSGMLDKMLYKVANFYDQLIRRTLKKVTAMIEPIFILFMGGIIAFIMLSILLPIFDMIKIFNPH